MRSFLEPLYRLREIEELNKELEKETGLYVLSGCVDAQKAHVMFGLGQPKTKQGMSEKFRNKLVVTYEEQRARELYEEYLFYDPSAVFYPAKDILFYQADLRGNVLTRERIKTLKKIAEGEEFTLFTTFDALLSKMPDAEAFVEMIQCYTQTDSIDLAKLRKDLVRMGYRSVGQVECAGQFAIRGGIVDIFPLAEEQPVRMELWGDEIDSIRTFDVESQRSLEGIEKVELYPAAEMVLTEEQKETGLQKIRKDAGQLYETYRKEFKTEEAYRVKTLVQNLEYEIEGNGELETMDSFLPYFYEEPVCLLDYFDSEHTLVIMDEMHRCMEQGKGTEAEFLESMKLRLEKGYLLPGQMEALYSLNELVAFLKKRTLVNLCSLEMKVPDFAVRDSFGIQTNRMISYNNSFELLVNDLKKYKKKGYAVILVSGSRTRARRLADDLFLEGLNSFFTEDTDRLVEKGEIMVLYGKLGRGYEYPLISFAVISESDIFGAKQTKKKKRRLYEGEKIAHFTDLSIGDYVVHENYGVGIYKGIEKLEVDQTVKDFIKIEYQKGDNLYVPATKLELIQKYAGADAKKPKLNKLGGQEWAKTKSRVRGAVREVAKELVDLYAKRQQNDGYVFSKDNVWQREFEEMFPYEETADQERAIEDTKRDMESTKIMDRLICGDVGYGKTEIAIRAAFKAVLDGKQVVYLCPTTILAQQHYNTFSQRMKDYPVVVDLLCRFRTTAQQKKTISELKKGMVDIVIGTHRVLSKDVEFKDLGLLIIDEEQRFGVAHKEKIKQLKNNVDVLTLTATPIPRTLHMSLAGIRDMSVLEEPPMDRLPIQTYVMEYNDELVREAIARELGRNGQVYYVYNRVNQMEECALKIAKLLPEAVVEYAHGQMREKELEDIMYRFINGEIDVLVSTTIIETGLDISNVNTMIIQDAENLGLSQLYQLRGRVGRSTRTSYAFLMYRKNKVLKEVAEKRLAAIREYTELGSGFKIAMRDLEIRGAGSILGEMQHGHMAAVGYDLYCKMLNEAVKVEKGIKSEEEWFETTIDLDIDAYIPERYIPNELQKLDIYKRIAAIENEEEEGEMLDELLDRFGDLPKSVANLLLIAQLKAQAHQCDMVEVKQVGNDVLFRFYEKARVEVSKIPELLECYEGAMKFVADKKQPYLQYNLKFNSRQKGSIPEMVKDVLTNTRQTLILGKCSKINTKN